MIKQEIHRTHHLVPVPAGWTPEQAWNAYAHGLPMLRQPPDDRPCPYGGGWAVFVVDNGTPMRVLSPEATIEMLPEGDIRSPYRGEA